MNQIDWEDLGWWEEEKWEEDWCEYKCWNWIR